MKVDLESMRREHDEYKNDTTNRSALIVEDDDLIFNIGGKLGDWKGIKTSVMARDHDGRKVLRWLISNGRDIDEEHIDIIQLQLDEVYL